MNCNFIIKNNRNNFVHLYCFLNTLTKKRNGIKKNSKGIIVVAASKIAIGIAIGIAIVISFTIKKRKIE